MNKFKTLLTISSLLILAACTNYGKKAKHGHVEVYYKDGITETEAQHTANLFFWIDSVSNNNTKAEKSVQLIKVNDTVCFRMVVDQERAKGMPDENFNAIGTIFSDSVFNHAPVKLELTDNRFKTVRAVPFKRIDFNEGAAQEDTTTGPKPAGSDPASNQ